MVESQPSKLIAWVRFPSPAPIKRNRVIWLYSQIHGFLVFKNMQPLCNTRKVERWLRVKIEYDIFIVILVIRGVLMGAIDFVKEAEEIAEKNLIEGKEITKKKVLTQRILKFICNEKNLDNKVKLLNFVKQISWYWSCQMNEFIKAQIEKLTTGNDLFIIKEVKASGKTSKPF